MQVQLFVGNLSPKWSEGDNFRVQMEKYGRVERAFVVHNAAGHSKVPSPSVLM